jgi:hypothetical protein
MNYFDMVVQLTQSQKLTQRKKLQEIEVTVPFVHDESGFSGFDYNRLVRHQPQPMDYVPPKQQVSLGDSKEEKKRGESNIVHTPKAQNDSGKIIIPCYIQAKHQELECDSLDKTIEKITNHNMERRSGRLKLQKIKDVTIDTNKPPNQPTPAEETSPEVEEIQDVLSNYEEIQII